MTLNFSTVIFSPQGCTLKSGFIMTDNRPHILITNDDGIFASGIKNLCQALSPYAHITVVAPLNEQSAVGLSTTLRQPLRIEKERWENYSPEELWSVTGTPADCVKLALNVIVKKRPNLVVSGINRGANIGRGILYSGTVAAAIESIMQDIPAIAFSCHDYHTEPDYDALKNIFRKLYSMFLNTLCPQEHF